MEWLRRVRRPLRELTQFREGGATGDRHRQNDIAIGMDGKGAWRKNVFVARRWKTDQSEGVNLHGYDTVAARLAGMSLA